jgi:hypothetical protein
LPACSRGRHYRKGVNSDERVAVVRLNECADPRVETEDIPEMPPTMVVHVIRRITLTARHHFLRDNIIYRSGNGIRLVILRLRERQTRRKDERHAASYYDRETWPVTHVEVRDKSIFVIEKGGRPAVSSAASARPPS